MKESQGALIVDMPYAEGEPPVLLKKNDGSTLYATRDLAAADRPLRALPLRPLALRGRHATSRSTSGSSSRVLETMGKPWADQLRARELRPRQGMSTRKGNVVLLNDVLDEAKSPRAGEGAARTSPRAASTPTTPSGWPSRSASGAIIFGDLKNRRTTDYTFDWDEVLSFEGHTGPYLQYAHARACNILRKGGGAPAELRRRAAHAARGAGAGARRGALPGRGVEAAVEQDEPSFVARHLLDVAAAFSRWYTLGNQDRDKRVLVEGNDALRAARLALTDAVRIDARRGPAAAGHRRPGEHVRLPREAPWPPRSRSSRTASPRSGTSSAHWPGARARATSTRVRFPPEADAELRASLHERASWST